MFTVFARIVLLTDAMVRGIAPRGNTRTVLLTWIAGTWIHALCIQTHKTLLKC